MFGIGVTELGVILVVALLVFGPKRLPELARTLGRGMAEFRRASNELRQSLALEDLQTDLRRDLKRPGTIHKPVTPPTRPAQAGDDMEPPSTPVHTPVHTPVKSAGEAPARVHPGELPLGNDHEHHDPVEEEPEESTGRPAPSAGSKSSEDRPPDANAAARPGEAARARAATPAHAGLGNVPVSDADPTDSGRG